MPRREPPGTVATNRRARHDYEILETIEAGVVLRGSEVKTLREGKASLQDAYAVLERALVDGSVGHRENIVNALGSMRDERAVPLFCHMVRSREFRRTMRRAYLAAVEGLGAVGGDDRG